MEEAPEVKKVTSILSDSLTSIEEGMEDLDSDVTGNKPESAGDSSEEKAERSDEEVAKEASEHDAVSTGTKKTELVSDEGSESNSESKPSSQPISEGASGIPSNTDAVSVETSTSASATDDASSSSSKKKKKKSAPVSPSEGSRRRKKLVRKGSRTIITEDGTFTESSDKSDSIDETAPKTPRRRPRTPKSPSKGRKKVTTPAKKKKPSSSSELPEVLPESPALLSRSEHGKKTPKARQKHRRKSLGAMTDITTEDSVPTTVTTDSPTSKKPKAQRKRRASPATSRMSCDNKSVISTNDWDDDYGDISSPRDHSNDQTDDDDALTWRLDPETSLSDWTIRITNKDDDTVKDFHVHKNMLAVGGRKSEYFATVFRTTARDANPSTVTDISMATAAITAMPALLDFMYSSEPLRVSTSNALGLRYLSRKLGVKKAFDTSMEFIHKDISLETVGQYYMDSNNLKDEKIMGTAAGLCGTHILTIEPSSELLRKFDAGFLAKIMASQAIDTDDKKKHVSLLVSAYCRYHQDTLAGDTFRMLTDEIFVPLIHRDAVLPLLDLEADLVVATSLESFTSMSSLQQRCLRDIAGHWYELSEKNPQETTRVCRKLPSFVVAELLGRSLMFSKVPATPDTGTEAEDSDEKQGELQKAHEEEITRLESEYEAKIKELEYLHAEKDRQIERYQKELQCFERLPNSHEGKLACSGMLKGHPTALPEIGEHERDGYILIAKKGGNRYPIFYYKSD